ncbi:MAG TPA: DUF167 domain-containing protein [Streptosporangiaceae bacterium]
MALTVTIRVQPGSARTVVGGRRGDALMVRVTARPVEGKATEAALRAVADAFGVRPREVHLVTGMTSREKVVRIDGDEQPLSQRLSVLRDSG